MFETWTLFARKGFGDVGPAGPAWAGRFCSPPASPTITSGVLRLATRTQWLQVGAAVPGVFGQLAAHAPARRPTGPPASLPTPPGLETHQVGVGDRPP